MNVNPNTPEPARKVGQAKTNTSSSFIPLTTRNTPQNQIPQPTMDNTTAPNITQQPTQPPQPVQMPTILNQNQQQITQTTPIQSTNLPTPEELPPQTGIPWEEVWYQTKKWAHRITTAGLTAQGIRGLYSSIIFIFVEYPKLELALEAHNIPENTINQFALKAGIIIVSTAVNMFFAVQLSLSQRKTVKVLNIIIGIIINIASFLLMQYSSQIQVLELLPEFQNITIQ